MKWIELSVEAPPEYVEPLSEVFYRYGHGGVAIEERELPGEGEGDTPPDGGWVTVKTYIPLDSSAEERRNHIDLAVRLVAHLCPISSLRERVLEEEDWQSAWKEHFPVLHIGKRTVVVPTWREYKPKRSDLIIEIDPGMAFGTGHHPTTRMCLELLEELVMPGVDLLDVGCGSGILSIAAAKLGAGSVLGLEVDPVAVRVAQANVQKNGVAPTTRIALGTLPHPAIPRDSYDITVANISAKVVTVLAGELVAVLRSGGTLIVSGILREASVEVAQRLGEAGVVVKGSHTQGDWVSLVLSVT